MTALPDPAVAQWWQEVEAGLAEVPYGPWKYHEGFIFHDPFSAEDICATTDPGLGQHLELMSPDRLAAALAEREALVKRVAEFEKAARAVEEWWLSEGMKHFTGAPYAMFATRAALQPQDPKDG